MKLWIAREKDGKLSAFTSKPKFFSGFWWGCDRFDLSKRHCKHLTQEDSPQLFKMKLLKTNQEEK